MSKNCIGISWGCDYGVVSVAATSDPTQPATDTDLLRTPTVLANADGNRASTLWLNVANDEFLFGDGARNATLRFPQQAVHGIVKLLDRESAHAACRAMLNPPPANSDCGKQCNCGCPCMVPRKLPSSVLTAAPTSTSSGSDAMDAAVLLQAADDEEDESTSSNNNAITFSDFVNRNWKMDSDGAIVDVSAGGDSGEQKLPETTWHCALVFFRMFRAVVKDALGKVGAAASAASSADASKPHVVVIAVPRLHVSRNVVSSLAQTAWKDWCSGGAAASACVINVVPEDVATLAAAMPAANLLAPSTSTSTSNNNKPTLSMVVNWGANALSISLFALFAGGGGSSSSSFSTLLATKTLESGIGGGYMDQLIAAELLISAKRKRLPPVELGTRSHRKFLQAAERAKIVLSSAMTTSVEIESAVEGMDFVEPGFTRGKLDMMLNGMAPAARIQGKFSELLNAVFAAVNGDRKTRALVEGMLMMTAAGESSSLPEVGVVLAGGVMRMPSLSTFVRSTCVAQLQNFVAATANLLQQQASSPVTPQQVKQAAWSSAPPTVDPQEIVSVGACNLSQAAAALLPGAAAAASSLFELGARSAGDMKSAAAPFEKQSKTTVSKVGGVDDIDDDGDDNGGAAAASDETVTTTITTISKNKFSAQSALISCSVHIGATEVIPAGTVLPARRPLSFPAGSSSSSSFELVVKKKQAGAAGKPATTVVMKFPVSLPEGATSCEVDVNPAGELAVLSGGEELVCVQL